MSEHHPSLMTTGRHGCWSNCSCGWESRLWTTGTGAHLEFGAHLAAVQSDPTTTPDDEERER